VSVCVCVVCIRVCVSVRLWCVCVVCVDVCVVVSMVTLHVTDENNLKYPYV